MVLAGFVDDSNQSARLRVPVVNSLVDAPDEERSLEPGVADADHEVDAQGGRSVKFARKVTSS